MRPLKITGIALIVLTALAWPLGAQEQEDGGPSLGDLARTLRKNKSQQQQQQQQPQKAIEPERTVIDNDNLSEVMEDTKRVKTVVQNRTVFSLDPSGNTVKVSSPDVTCSMSFNARASSLLVRPVLIETLPLDELVKLDGPGSIQNENLQLEVFNGTDWALREITVGLTLERRPGEDAERAARARVIPASGGTARVMVERHSDVTLLYHLRTEAKPFSRTAVRENIGITPGPDEDWHWSIVEAKGIRPAGAKNAAPESLSAPLYGERVQAVPITNDPPGVRSSRTAPATTDKK